MLKKIINYYRIDEWYSSKIPLAMAMLLYACRDADPTLSDQQFLSSFLFFFLFWVCFFAFNYLFNDYADLEKDREAGKVKVIQSVPPKVTLLNLCLLLIISIVLCLVFFLDRPLVAVVAVFSYLLGMAYSAKGIRLKEFGVIGVIECSFAQRNTPILILLVMVPVKPIAAICWMCIVFINGLRYILVHQLLDKENDKKVGIQTLVTSHDLPYKQLIVIFWVIELVLLVVLFKGTLFTAAGLIFVTVYALFCLLNHIFIKKVLHQSYMFSFANLPLEDLYNVFLPIILSVTYGLEHGYWWLIAAALVYLCIPIVQKTAMPMMCLFKLITTDISLFK
ncbi:UbiA family prenyltransferase [Ruminococcus sp.]|uniref:UbiA family prenyltransferase n=1 Tax=Ruminococcus sp. TaxID=41978 RepID=UPI002E791534|nr:UbiA family prenyltransferase [Ruminococcus sp.]MEE1396878.1 UbiA family prenyltransferase [Ruminococcus sp.]